jgi:dTDP-4-amino-4,6-dideoxygalactose transaminase
MKLPFIDLKSQYSRLEDKIRARIDQVLNHGQFIMGPEIRELETQLAQFAGVEHALSCSSGTDALLMALMALDIGPGDAVFTTPFSFIATAEVISLCGATPVFVDIDPLTLNIDSRQLEQTIQAVKDNDNSLAPLPQTISQSDKPLRPAAIIPVDLFGLPAEYEQINHIAQEHGLFVIEDAAQSFGAEYKGQKSCSLADIACTSFFPAKPLGCYGDGGAVFTSDQDLAQRMSSIRIHGTGSDKYNNERIGLNARMDTMQAAILLPKLEIFPEELERREQIANHYNQLFSSRAPWITIPHIPQGLRSAWAQYSVFSPLKDKIRSALQEEGIPTAVYYERPLHLQTAYNFLGYSPGDMPVAEKASETIFSLPMHPYLEDQQVESIVQAVANTSQET